MAVLCSFETFESVYETTRPHLQSALYLLWSVYVETYPSVANDMSIGYTKLQMLTFQPGLNISKSDIPTRLAQWQRVSSYILDSPISNIIGHTM
jgi:hypothetical protein